MKKRNFVGTRIRKARKIANPPVTQKDLIARLDLLGMKIDQSILSKIENGQREISDIEIRTMAKALKVSISWLMNEENKD